MSLLNFLRTEYQFAYAALAVMIVCIGMGYSLLISPPYDFPEESIVVISSGETLGEVAHELAEKRIISSPRFFIRLVMVLGGEDGVQAGSYYFQTPQHATQIAKRLIDGEQGLTPLRVTVPEGSTRDDIAAIFSDALPAFNTDEFLAITENKEGFLFPDTYLFYPHATAVDVAERMLDTFQEKTVDYIDAIVESDRSMTDIITMASIVEAEAFDPDDQKVIAGILWNRIAIDMPLQVDVTFRYINGKTTFDLTLDDLADESPYNTYVHKGLPPTPINNPGLSAIEATVFPMDTNYLFFLADASGTTHFSETFDEHVAKKNIYLP